MPEFDVVPGDDWPGDESIVNIEAVYNAPLFEPEIEITYYTGMGDDTAVRYAPVVVAYEQATNWN